MPKQRRGPFSRKSKVKGDGGKYFSQKPITNFFPIYNHSRNFPLFKKGWVDASYNEKAINPLLLVTNQQRNKDDDINDGDDDDDDDDDDDEKKNFNYK